MTTPKHASIDGDTGKVYDVTDTSPKQSLKEEVADILIAFNRDTYLYEVKKSNEAVAAILALIEGELRKARSQAIKSYKKVLELEGASEKPHRGSKPSASKSLRLYGLKELLEEFAREYAAAEDENYYSESSNVWNGSRAVEILDEIIALIDLQPSDLKATTEYDKAPKSSPDTGEIK